MSLFGIGGTQVVTADATIGTSGKPIRVFAAHLINAGSSGVVVLRNGTSASGTVYIQEAGTTTTNGETFTYGRTGVLFPDGCFYDHEANNTSVTITYFEEN